MVKSEAFKLTLTEKAAEMIKSVMAKQGKPNAALRVFVTGGGCYGFSYGMALDEKAKDGDKTTESLGIKIVVDPESAKFLHGSEIDYVETLMGSGFTVNNPNAVETCGCGQSFKTR